MLFRKNVYDRIEDIASGIKVEPIKFLRIPELGCRIAENVLEFPNGRPVTLDFAEAQLLARKLGKNNNLDIRVPRTMEGYLASQKSDAKNSQYEWRSELIDGSFLMVDPDIRMVNNDRKYDFFSKDVSLVRGANNEPKNNGNLCWIGISRDKHDRAALVSNFDKEKYLIGAVPPLSKDYLGIRLLIDENKKD